MNEYIISEADKTEGEKLIMDIRDAIRHRKIDIRFVMAKLVKLNDVFLNARRVERVGRQ